MERASDDVEVELLERRTGYEGFFRISVYRLRHRLFDGSMGAPITREVSERGNAVAVLPYDPRLDSVLLIRQFLPGAWAGGRPARPLMAIAGMLDKEGEAPLDVALREAWEEAGIGLGRIVPALGFLPSPGGSSERIQTFCGEADLARAGGVHGLVEEAEDIAVEVLQADEAIRLLDAGEIEAGPAVVLLSWFARNRARLRHEWAGERGR